MKVQYLLQKSNFKFSFFSQIDEEDIERIEEHAKMLKRKYLNKKYFFSQTGPIDHETQNIVIFIPLLEKIYQIILSNINLKDFRKNWRLEPGFTRQASK